MNISDHAVRRYKQRLGLKSASKQRIMDKINKELEANVINKYYKNNKLHIQTTKFIAVCYKNTVVTILPPPPNKSYRGVDLNDRIV